MGAYIIRDAYQKLQEIWRQREGYPVPPQEPKRLWGTVLWLALPIILICLAYWGNGNHLAVEVSVEDPTKIRQWQEEREGYQRKIAELTTANNARAVKIKSLLYVINQYEQQLKALTVSVPPQPVILQAVQKEASTPAGLQRVVERNFGSELAAKIKIMGE